jgi:peptide/nickel transport system substrate-binding protein
MRKMFALLSLLVIASMTLAACGGTPATSAPATEPGTVATEAPQATEAPEAAGFHSADSTTFVNAKSELSIDTLDPALAYDTASGEVIFNVYETLIFYDGEATDKFVPMLAESYELSDDGATWTFHIRSGVKFHEGGDMTASDVAYSYQRGLLQGGYASPQWLLAEPFFGIGNDDISLVAGDGSCADDRDCMSALDPAALVAACEKVQGAIVADDAAGTVTMTLAGPWGPFLPTIAQSWGSVMDKEWVMEKGGWDGTCATWQNFYAMDSASDPFSAIANGTGPFKLEKIANGEEVVLVRNDAYWREPAKLERVVLRQVSEWGTRFTMMQAGDADSATVPVENRSQMDALVGERCEFNLEANAYDECQETDAANPFRLRIGQPNISQDVIIFNFGIAGSEESPNPLAGSNKLDGNGIPGDFFDDVHIRRAFAYCFDWDPIISDVYNGEAIQSFQLPLPGMPGYSLDTPHYSNDLAKCEEEFKLADLDHDGIPAGDDPEGDVWTTGFRLQMGYNQGNNTRQIVAEVMAGNVSSVNELFSIETLGLPFAAYLRAQRAFQIPIMTGGWLEDIHDAHNWYQPYTVGAYGARQRLSDELKEQIRPILEAGVSETDPAKRAEIYAELNQLYYDQAIGVPIVLSTTHGFTQRWVQGLNTNPILPGIYFYTISKD